MKTYQEILNDTIEYYIRHEVPTQTSPEERAAKEYAKQWIDRFVDRINWIDENIGSDTSEIKKEIDAQ